MNPAAQAKHSADALSVRSWLMKAPRPRVLRVISRDGRDYDLELKEGAPWSETASTVVSLEPEHIEAKDDKGKLLRAVKVAELLQREEADEHKRAATAAAIQSSDPETQRMLVFANLIAEAHTRSTEAIERTSAAMFERIQLICDALASMAHAGQQSSMELTVALRQLMISQAHEAAKAITEAAAEKEDGPLEQLAASFLQGAHARQATEAAAAAAAQQTNGKATTNGKAVANGKRH